MTLNTRFSGYFEISPPLNATEQDKFRCTFNPKNPTIKHGEYPASRCQWEITNTGSRISWDGDNYFRNFKEWIESLCLKWFGPRAHDVNGEVMFFVGGEQKCGIIRVRSNKTEWRVFDNYSPFIDNHSALRYVVKVIGLHGLAHRGMNDFEIADVLRDSMDPLWEDMSKEEKKLVDQIGCSLYNYFPLPEESGKIEEKSKK